MHVVQKIAMFNLKALSEQNSGVAWRHDYGRAPCLKVYKLQMGVTNTLYHSPLAHTGRAFQPIAFRVKIYFKIKISFKKHIKHRRHEKFSTNCLMGKIINTEQERDNFMTSHQSQKPN